MQHKFGKPLHRSTKWRQANAPEYEFVVEVERNGKVERKAKIKRGRRFSEDALTETFILFAGAAIELQNTKGYCDYGDVFNGVAQGTMGFRYYKVPGDIYKKLVESKFPPQLLAVVVSDLIPLNLKTRGGRHTSVKLDFQGKVKQLPWPQVFENENDLSSGRPNQKFRSLNSADDIVTAESSCEMNFAEMDERNGWHEQNETSPSQPAQRLLHIRKEKGTPVYRIPFHGGFGISRRMACYWRNDCRREYNRCKKFIGEALLKNPAPVAPYSERVATYAPLLNAKFNEYMKQRNDEHAASKKKIILAATGQQATPTPSAHGNKTAR